jgi:ubiquinone/menaquinone biosynthesis C-methylase UbiE
MGIYTRWIFPRLIDWAMSAEEATRYRQALVPRAQGLVLEIGVGSGHNLPFYTDAVERLIGLDSSPELLRRTRTRSSLSRVPLHLIRASAEAIPLKDASVDTVVMTWVLCSIPDVRRALAEIRRVLRREGQLLFVEHGLAPERQVASWQHRLDPLWVRVSCHLDRKMDALITHAGFTLTDFQTGYSGKGPRVLTYMYSGRATPLN